VDADREVAEEALAAACRAGHRVAVRADPAAVAASNEEEAVDSAAAVEPRVPVASAEDSPAEAGAKWAVPSTRPNRWAPSDMAQAATRPLAPPQELLAQALARAEWADPTAALAYVPAPVRDDLAWVRAESVVPTAASAYDQELARVDRVSAQAESAAPIAASASVRVWAQVDQALARAE
jgi:hypothetical protein